MPQVGVFDIKQARRDAANDLSEAKIYGPARATELLVTGQATPKQRMQIALLHGQDPRVSKALRGEFD